MLVQRGSPVPTAPSLAPSTARGAADDVGLRFNRALRAAAPRLATDLAARAEHLGLCVTKAGGGTTPIPIAATVVVVDDTTMGRHQQTAALLSSATVKMARAAIANADLREAVLERVSFLGAN
jgi:hypothetical protein